VKAATPGRSGSWYDGDMMKSIGAVLIGILLALGLGVLVVFGIVAPVFTFFFGPELASTALPAVIVLFAAAFAFYFGGMVASYKAPRRRRLHGVLVGVVSFAISPLANLGASALSAGGTDPFANLRTPGALLFTGVLFVAILVASYVGARRGEELYAHNQAFIRRQKRRRRSEEGS
jgi:putative membrane protein (TIGR04086 family)